ncbi:uncharacterized protein LOC118756296, partial [Rhagoletis pomonella]|uniref:uncharacterized protein LOC118756296 n=1 Tax=Rhagoletis pomonella TaxID=28610 RepID=UPI00177FE09D
MATESAVMADFLFDSNNIITFCEHFEKEDPEDHTDTLLEIKLEDLNARWERLQLSYRKVCLTDEKYVPTDFKEEAGNKFQLCTDGFYICKSHILDQLKLVQGSSSNPANTSQQANLTRHSMSFVDNAIPCIKVPPCDTQIFYGSYEDWPAFRDMFTAVYLNHPKLTQAQKLYHLRNKTRGKAGSIVKHYTLCDENFPLAWEALRARFENKRILIDKQLKTLFNLPSANSENSEAIQRIQNTINDCLSCLKSQGVSVSDWDPILIYLCSTKLPDETLSLWEQSLKSRKELPNWSQMDEFLTSRYEVVERLYGYKITKARNSFPQKIPAKIQSYHSQEQLSFKCKLCNNSHTLKFCSEFKKLNVQERTRFVEQNGYCTNCLAYNHILNDCSSAFRCFHCKKNHHTMLHPTSTTKSIPKTPSRNNNFKPPKNQPPQGSKSSKNATSLLLTQSSEPSSSKSRHPIFDITEDNTLPEESPTSLADKTSNIQANFSTNNETTLLPTAQVHIEHLGEFYTLRALIDQGSQKTFISEKIQNRLKLPTNRENFSITGMGGKIVENATRVCHITLVAKRNNIRINTKAIILHKLTSFLPTFQMKKPDLSELRDLDLADPYFFKPSQIDLVIGSDLIPEILLPGVKHKILGSLLAQNTIFGWYLSGPLKITEFSTFHTYVMEDTSENLNSQLKRFWELEEVSETHPPSAADEFCEKLYQDTTYRQSDGRYVVRLPFKSEFPSKLALGPSRTQAMKQAIRMEHMLNKKPDLKEEYSRVLEEYLSLDHMKPSSPDEIHENSNYRSYYLPHHSVVKPDSKSTKVRVVFNASKPSASGVSLNDILHIGPTLQTDLMFVILNWRLYKYVFNGDIQKMYRQILLHEDDQQYQRILFRRKNDIKLTDFALQTVTFGVNCAPYLAIRTLHQLAKDSKDSHPLAKRILTEETYVDDILTGGHDIQTCLTAQSQIIKCLLSAGFPLKKLTANHPELLRHISTEDLLDSEFLKIDSSSSTKTLGIRWNALNDAFSYSIEPIKPTT